MTVKIHLSESSGHILMDMKKGNQMYGKGGVRIANTTKMKSLEWFIAPIGSADGSAKISFARTEIGG